MRSLNKPRGQKVTIILIGTLRDALAKEQILYTILLMRKVCLIIKRISEKRGNLVEKDVGLLQVQFLYEKRAVPDFDDSLVSLGFKLFKARNAFSPSPAE